MKKHWIAAIVLFTVVLLSGCVLHQTTEQEELEQFELIQENICTLSNGGSIDVYRSNRRYGNFYMIDNGSFILNTDNTFYLQSANVLTDEQKLFIQSYYEQQELPYNLLDELEKAYTLYTARQEKNITYLNIQPAAEDEHVYSPPSIDISWQVVGYNDNIICVEQYYYTPAPLERLRNPLSEINEIMTYYTSTIFDSHTGEVINQYDLFTIPQDEIPEVLLKYSAYLGDDEIVHQMMAEMKPEYLSFTDHGISISFPDGVIGDGSSYMETIHYNHVDDVLYSWAIPNTKEE